MALIIAIIDKGHKYFRTVDCPLSTYTPSYPQLLDFLALSMIN